MTQDRRATWTSRLLLAIAAALVAGSVWLPYWSMRVFAPQYPKGLELVVYPNRLEGDVREIDTLNHYIGMRSLEHGAVLERRLSFWGLGAVVAGLLLAAWMPGRWVWVGVVPVLLVPLLFAGDLWWWLMDYGLHLDPKAPLNRAVKPFMPPLLGQGKVAQFDVVAGFRAGWGLVVLAGMLAVAGARLKTRGLRKCLTLFWPKVSDTSMVLALAAALLAQPQTAHAARWDVGPGMAHASLQQALESAQDGDTVLVHGGVHHGPFKVARSLALIGVGQPVLDGGGQGTVLEVSGPGSTVRGLTIRNSGNVLAAEDTGILVRTPQARIEANRLEDVLFGIYVRQAPGSVIRGNWLQARELPVPRRGDLIRVWYSDDVTIEGNQVLDGRDVVFWYSKDLMIRGNDIRGGRYGLHFMYCQEAVVEDNHLEANSVGAYLMYSAGLKVRRNTILRHRGPSGYGLGLKDMEQVDVERNLIADNRVGIFLEHASGAYTGNVVAYNDIGVWAWPSARDNRMLRNALVENGEQAKLEGDQAGVNVWEENFWSDYRGYDADGDGVGDVPYRLSRLFERVTDRLPALRLYHGSPAAQALDLAARMFPVFAPRPVLMDPKPLMRMGPDLGAG